MLTQRPCSVLDGSPAAVTTSLARAAYLFTKGFARVFVCPQTTGTRKLSFGTSRNLRNTATAVAHKNVTQTTHNGLMSPNGVVIDGSLNAQAEYLRTLLGRLSSTDACSDKIGVLEGLHAVQTYLRSPRGDLLARFGLPLLTVLERYVILCLIAMGQDKVLPSSGPINLEALKNFAAGLVRVDEFYNSLGGLVGYQLKCIELIMVEQSAADNQPESSIEYEDLMEPTGVNLFTGAKKIVDDATAKGLDALPAMAEIYPLGGAGDRLGLTCDVTGECLPTAVLPYCGRTLLEGLIRDLQAREYLYFQLYGKQYTTPIAIMTSDAKGNHRRVQRLLESCNWFGRGKENFRLFRQPLVPVVGDDGQWVVSGTFAPVMKPGGHGAIWKLMLDHGVFYWLFELEREAAIVRQISNPMAGTDNTLLALSGVGYFDSKSFGFASCDRTVGAAEGINVLRHRKLKVAGTQETGESLWEYEYGITNVEYTEFERLGVSDQADGNGSQLSKYPANTNVLYIGLKAAKAAVLAGVKSGGGAALPGMLLNLKKLSYRDPLTNARYEVKAGRLECTMQNLADCFTQKFRGPLPRERHADLDTFMVLNTRRKVTSSAKRARKPDSLAVAQTPDGSFLDLMRNARELLEKCGVQVPPVRDVADYLLHGPGMVFLYHPAIGPLWSVVMQKIQGGSLAPDSELVLEVAEVHMKEVHIQGSLLVHANEVMGQSMMPQMRDQHKNGATLEQSEWVDGVYPVGTFDAVYAENGHRYNGSTTSPADRAAAASHSDSRLVYGANNARIRMKNCVIRNKGVDWHDPENVFWKHKLARKEAVRVILEGRSEFQAEGVVLEGSYTFRVPDGYRMLVSHDEARGIVPELIPLGSRPSWEWQYQPSADKVVQLKLKESLWWDQGQLPLQPYVLLGGEDMGILI